MRRCSTLRFAATLAALGGISAGCTPEGALPPSELPWPGAEVTIIRDDRGFPHVYAESDEDALFGAGYAMARDRTAQMELYRRQARGTKAEVLGEAFTSSDVASRMIRFDKLGEADYALAKAEHPGDALLVEGWVAGVNRHLAELRSGAAPLPASLGPAGLDFIPEDWTPADGFAVGKLLAFGLSDSLNATLLSTVMLALVPDASANVGLIKPAIEALPAGEYSTGEPAPYWIAPPGAPQPEYPADLLAAAGIPPPKFGPLPNRLGSNNWAVVGSRTSTGRPIVCGDPHQEETSPGRFFPLHMSSLQGGGSLDVAGFAFPGTPSIQLGHNQRVAWTGTVNYADAMDVYDVVAGAGTVTVGGEQAELVTRTETIAVKGAEPRTVTYEDVPGWGVLLPEEMLPLPPVIFGQGRLLFTWTGFDGPTTEASAYFGMDRAQDVGDFEEAVQLLQVGAVNFVSADQDHVLYTVHADIPDRGDPSAREMPWHVVPGGDAAALWKGPRLPREKFPRSFDPEQGFVVTANQDPMGFTFDGDVRNDPFYYGAFYDPGFRAGRASAAIAGISQFGGVTPGELAELQDDVHSTMADLLVPLVQSAVSAIGTDPALAEFEGKDDLVALQARLVVWDRRFARGSNAPFLFTAFEHFAVKRAFEGALTPTLFSSLLSASPPYVLGGLAKLVQGKVVDPAYFAPEGIAVLLLRALDETSVWAMSTYGSFDAVPSLEEVSFARFSSDLGSAFEPGLVSVEGSDDTLNVAESRFFGDGGLPNASLVTGGGAVYRMTVAFGDSGPETLLAFAGGATEDPASPWFASELDDWLDGKHGTLWFRKNDVLAHEVERVVIPSAR